MNTRTFPTGAVIVRPKNLNNVEIALYGQDEFGRCNAMGYQGKQTKPEFRYRFKSLAARDRHIAEFIAKCRSLVTIRAERAESRKAQDAVPNPLKAGDILYSSWGYDQTNIDFYQVVESKGQFVKIRQLRAEITESGHLSMSGNAKPVGTGVYKPNSEIIRRKVNVYGADSIYVRIDSCASASPWDGVPKTCSWYA